MGDHTTHYNGCDCYEERITAPLLERIAALETRVSALTEDRDIARESIAVLEAQLAAKDAALREIVTTLDERGGPPLYLIRAYDAARAALEELDG
jgi:hypothetical protein